MLIHFLDIENWVIAKPEFERLDGLIAQQFTQAVMDRCDGHSRLILDLVNVSFVDSRGLSSLVAIYKGLPAGGVLRLANLTDQVELLLTLTRMNTLFTAYASVQQALQR